MNLVNLNIRHSIKNRLFIEFNYESETVVVEPFVYGVSQTGFLGLLAYQIKSNDVKNTSWRLFDLDISKDIKIHCEGFEPQLRSDYATEVKKMKIIYAKI